MEIDRLARELSLLLGDRAKLIGTAQLELAAQPLHDRIVDFARDCLVVGVSRVIILPLFLLPGVHVMEDIPAQVNLARQSIGADGLEIIVAPFLGTYPAVGQLFGDRRSQLPDRTILLAHGSRREGGNQIVEQLALALDLEPAYWSVSPSLTDRVTALVDRGAKEIGILPYFLFAGGITDAIGELVTQLEQQFPSVRINLAQPIGNSPALLTALDRILTEIAN
jgi:sirohydrochlorin cobaltochelatase